MIVLLSEQTLHLKEGLFKILLQIWNIIFMNIRIKFTIIEYNSCQILFKIEDLHIIVLILFELLQHIIDQYLSKNTLHLSIVVFCMFFIIIYFAGNFIDRGIDGLYLHHTIVSCL